MFSGRPKTHMPSESPSGTVTVVRPVAVWTWITCPPAAPGGTVYVTSCGAAGCATAIGSAPAGCTIATIGAFGPVFDLLCSSDSLWNMFCPGVRAARMFFM